MLANDPPRTESKRAIARLAYDGVLIDRKSSSSLASHDLHVALFPVECVRLTPTALSMSTGEASPG